MSVITNKWNDESGDSISIESPSFQGNQTVKISSPVQKDTSKRSMKFIGKCKKDSSKQVILTVEQEASTYTYDLTLNSDNTEIAAKGGTANITAVLKTYRNGNLVSTDNITPVLSGSATGFSISGTKVTASNRTTTVGSRRSIVVTGKYSNTFDGQTVSSTITIYQEANAVIDDNYDEHLSSYGTPEMVIFNQITAAGGTARAAGVVRNTYTYYDLYTSGSTVPYTRTKAGVYKIEMISNGNNRFSMDDTYLITHSSMGANVTTDTAKFRCYNESDRTKYVDDSISVSNRIESYNYGSWNISISANPTSLPATGGTSTITSSCTRSKTPIYTSGSTGTATTESATPTLALTTNPGGFTLSGNKLTAANNPIGAKTATVTASYSGATSKSVSVSQAAGPDGIGYMQIQGDGTSHPIFRVGGNTRSVEPMSINETSETASDEDVSIFASIKKFLTKFV
jgi:ribosome-associated translation inhibitor RaiA